MANTTSRMSRTKPPHEKRLYWGSELSRLLILWLNSTKGTPKHKRIVSLLTQIYEYFAAIGERAIPIELSEVGSLWWQGRPILGGTRFDYPSRQGAVNKAGDAIRAAFLKYAFRSELACGFGGRLLFDWIPAKGNWRKLADHVGDHEDQFVFTETHAVVRIVELCQEGLILRVRMCRCGVWFFVKFSHQKFHSTACQQRAYRDDPEWKAYRREYMKRNRALHAKQVLRSTREPIRSHSREKGE
jgi:hypothetical protein